MAKTLIIAVFETSCVQFVVVFQPVLGTDTGSMILDLEDGTVYFHRQLHHNHNASKCETMVSMVMTPSLLQCTPSFESTVHHLMPCPHFGLHLPHFGCFRGDKVWSLDLVGVTTVSLVGLHLLSAHKIVDQGMAEDLDVIV